MAPRKRRYTHGICGRELPAIAAVASLVLIRCTCVSPMATDETAGRRHRFPVGPFATDRDSRCTMRRWLFYSVAVLAPLYQCDGGKYPLRAVLDDGKDKLLVEWLLVHVGIS